MHSPKPTAGLTLQLDRSMFGSRPGSSLIETQEFKVCAWSTKSAIETLQIENAAGRVQLLPFLGQQIWRAHFHGRELAMKSIFADPVETPNYHLNNGAYLVHCDGSAMGNPGIGDLHPLHGELPNAAIDSASLHWHPAGPESPESLTINGELTHRRAFGAWFTARLQLTLFARSGLMESRVELRNLSAESRPLMYLAHINFRPAISGVVLEELLPGHSISTRGEESVGEFVAERVAPQMLLAPKVHVSPEIVQTVPLLPDEQGWKTSRQVHPDGSVDFVRHRDPLTHTIRWMRRTGDDQAFAFAMPATAEPDGYLNEKRKGNVVSYKQGQGITARFFHGALASDEELPKG